MRGLLENLDSPLGLQSQGTLKRSMDFVGLWEKWAAEGTAALLESAGALSEAGQWIILAGAPEAEYFEDHRQCCWKDSSGISPAPFGFWDFADHVGQTKKEFFPLPFCLASAWFGVLSYDFGKAVGLRVDTSHSSTPPLVPGFYFFKPSQIVAVNRRSKEYFLFGRKNFEPFAQTGTTRLPFKVRNLKAQSSRAQYESMVQRAQDYIGQGDIYQANLAHAFQAHWEGSAGTLYRILREMNPGPFMGLFQGKGFTVVSSSPERLAAGRGDWLETRPIAGTRPRGKNELEDLQLKVELKTNPKEQAEHLMLVDLARNDLGQVSQYGSVEVRQYADIESYARVHHLVSTVESKRRKSATLSEILRSLFPGGTITGCPKIRCMEIIQELESRPRGFYTGSMGYMAPGPSFDLNILIRSFTLFSGGLLEFHAGAGIVADSNPRREHRETLYKVEALAQALGTTFFKGNDEF